MYLCFSHFLNRHHIQAKYVLCTKANVDVLYYFSRGMQKRWEGQQTSFHHLDNSPDVFGSNACTTDISPQVPLSQLGEEQRSVGQLVDPSARTRTQCCWLSTGPLPSNRQFPLAAGVIHCTVQCEGSTQYTNTILWMGGEHWTQTQVWDTHRRERTGGKLTNCILRLPY